MNLPCYIRMRCQYDLCRTKIPSLIEGAYQCKCQSYYCRAHLLPEYHGCPVDYRALGTEELKKKLIKVESDKIIRV